MTLNDYQSAAATTRTPETYDEGKPVIYPTLGLTGESGEVADKVKKVLRDNHGEFTPDVVRDIALELGDVLWYVSQVAADLGYSLDEIARMNLDKLSARAKNNKIHGNGDHR